MRVLEMAVDRGGSPVGTTNCSQGRKPLESRTSTDRSAPSGAKDRNSATKQNDRPRRFFVPPRLRFVLVLINGSLELTALDESFDRPDSELQIADAFLRQQAAELGEDGWFLKRKLLQQHRIGDDHLQRPAADDRKSTRLNSSH